MACWGSDSNGKATPPAGTFATVSAGRSHTCWGENERDRCLLGRRHARPVRPSHGNLHLADRGRIRVGRPHLRGADQRRRRVLGKRRCRPGHSARRRLSVGTPLPEHPGIRTFGSGLSVLAGGPHRLTRDGERKREPTEVSSLSWTAIRRSPAHPRRRRSHRSGSTGSRSGRRGSREPKWRPRAPRRRRASASPTG